MVGAPLGVDAGDTLPHGGGSHATAHVTPPWLASFATVAVNCAVFPAETVAKFGAIEIVKPGTVIVDVAPMPSFDTATACTVTPRSPIGSVVGAEYVVDAPLAVVVCDSVPHGALPQTTDQITPPLAGSLVTVAVRLSVPPTATVAAGGETAIEIGATFTTTDADLL